MDNRIPDGKYRSDTGDALAAGTALAKPVTNPHPESKHAMLVPAGYLLEYFERADTPVRAAGRVVMNDAKSFTQYWANARRAESKIYGAMQPVSFIAVFNDHDASLPGWRDYRCTYTPAHSREWLAWSGHDRKPFGGNEAFAAWLEDNAVDVATPPAAKMMDIALNMKVSQIQGFSKAVRLADGNIDLAYTNEVEASGRSAAGGKITIPELFTLEIPVFSGIDAAKYRMDARFRYRLSGGALTIFFELVRPHKVIERAFVDLLGQIEDGTKIGTYIHYSLPFVG